MTNFFSQVIAQRLPALGNTRFRQYWMAQSLSLVGSWMQSLSLPWVSYTLSESPFWLGVASAVQFTPLLIMSLPAGAIVDRLDKGRVVLVTQIGLAILSLTMAILLGLGVLTYPLLLVIAFSMGSLQAMDFPARQAMVQQFIGQAHISNAVALNSSVFNAARLVGPALAGMVMVAWGPVWCFVINSLSYIPVILVLGSHARKAWTDGLREGLEGESRQGDADRGRAEGVGAERASDEGALPTRAKRGAEVGLGAEVRRIMGSVREAMVYVGKRAALRKVLINAGIMGIFGVNQTVILPVRIREVLGGGETSFSMLISAMGLGSFGSAIYLAARGKRPPLTNFMPWFALVSALALAILGEVESLRGAALLMVLLGMGNVAFFTTANASLQHGSSFEYRGRVMAMYALVFGGFAPLGSMISGSAMARWNSQMALWICSAAIVILVVVHEVVDRRRDSA